MTTDHDYRKYSVGMLPTNCFIVADRYLIDPGGINDELEDHLTSMGGLDAILLTHAHWDHIDAIKDVKRLAGECPIFCHSQEREILRDANKNFSSARGTPLEIEADGSLDEIEILLDDDELEILHTPGHTAGSVSFYWKSKSLLFSGDLLFKGGIGRTDLPGGDHNVLLESLQTVVEQLPDETRVLPGHGPDTTIGAEKQTNPYL